LARRGDHVSGKGGVRGEGIKNQKDEEQKKDTNGKVTTMPEKVSTFEPEKNVRDEFQQLHRGGGVRGGIKKHALRRNSGRKTWG